METQKAVKALFITAVLTAALSLGFRAGGGEMVQIWALVFAVTAAGSFTLAIVLPKYSKANQSTKLFSAVVSLGLALILLGASFTLLHKVNGLIADDLNKNGPGEFMASCWSNTVGTITGGKIATISITKNGVEETLDVESNAGRVVGAIFLVVISYVIAGRGFINSIPDSTKEWFSKLMAWLIILAIIGGVGYGLYKLGAFEWGMDLIESKMPAGK